MGAAEGSAVWKVTMPHHAPGIVAATQLAFTV
jgi:ABC-type spermidine/putrescine transport system permease subunit II